MSQTTLTVTMLERLAEARRRVRETAVKLRQNVTYALNGRSGDTDTAGPSQPQLGVRLLDDCESAENLTAP